MKTWLITGAPSATTRLDNPMALKSLTLTADMA